MKNILNTIAATSVVLFASFFSSISLAAHYETDAVKVFATEVVGSKSAAWEKGNSFIQSLQDKKGFALQKALGIQYQAFGNKASVQSTKVTVEEFSSSPGVISYQANVEVEYSYKVFDSQK